MKPLDEWQIVGMNHYHSGGVRFLFVAMVHQDRDGRYIQREGPDEVYLWNQLAADAIAHAKKPA